jgi:hypothetical protein
VKEPKNPMSWYHKRYLTATRWRRFRNPEKLWKFFAIGGTYGKDCIAFRSTTPLVFLKTNNKVNKYKIEYFDWQKRVITKNVIIEDVKCRTYCACTQYGNPNGTVIITRLCKEDDNTTIFGFQDHNATYIAIMPKIKTKKEICEEILELVPKRTREQVMLQARGRFKRDYTPLSQEFCIRDHRDVNFHMNFGWLCRGVESSKVRELARLRDNIRPCTCRNMRPEDLTEFDLRDSDFIKRDEAEFDAHGRDFFKCSLPWYREYADPLLACLD